MGNNSGRMIKIKVEVKEANYSNQIARTSKFNFPSASSYSARRIVMRNLMDFLLAREFYSWVEAFGDALTFDLKKRGKLNDFNIKMDGNTLTFEKRKEG